MSLKCYRNCTGGGRVWEGVGKNILKSKKEEETAQVG
jgi:hypothetical protein